MEPLDLNSSVPVPRPDTASGVVAPIDPMTAASDAIDAMLAASIGHVSARRAATTTRRASDDPHGSATIAAMRTEHRHTYVKLRYVLLQHRIICRCGAGWVSPVGLYEESQSTKGGATIMTKVASLPHALPRVIRTEPMACNECETCAQSTLGFAHEVRAQS